MPARSTATKASTTRTSSKRAQRHWLVKTEPRVFSFDDLWNAPARTTGWTGVRNYQARNYMRDDMAVGDLVLVYHSSTDPAGIAGVAEIARPATADPTALDPNDEAYDPKSTQAEPIWLQVDVRAVERFPRLVTLAELRATPALAEMVILRRGNRLSVTPVTAAEFAAVRRLARQSA